MKLTITVNENEDSRPSTPLPRSLQKGLRYLRRSGGVIRVGDGTLAAEIPVEAVALAVFKLAVFSTGANR